MCYRGEQSQNLAQDPKMIDNVSRDLVEKVPFESYWVSEIKISLSLASKIESSMMWLFKNYVYLI